MEGVVFDTDDQNEAPKRQLNERKEAAASGMAAWLVAKGVVPNKGMANTLLVAVATVSLGAGMYIVAITNAATHRTNDPAREKAIEAAMQKAKQYKVP